MPIAQTTREYRITNGRLINPSGGQYIHGCECPDCARAIADLGASRLSMLNILLNDTIYRVYASGRVLRINPLTPEPTPEPIIEPRLRQRPARFCDYCGNQSTNTVSVGHPPYRRSWLCPSCLGLMRTCDRCQYPIRPAQTTRHVDGETWCLHCYRALFVSCAACACVMRRGTEFNINGGYYCATCVDTEFITCAGCDGRFWRTETHEYRGETFCADCHTDNSQLLDYGYKPTWISRLVDGETEDKALTFGLEIESENMERVELADTLCNMPPYMFAKYDSSIDSGAEFVTHPLSWKYIHANIREFSDFLSVIIAQGWRSYNTGTCGIHIHIPKRCVSSLTLLKLMRLFYHHPNFIMAVSQRSRANLESWGSVWNQSGESENMVYKAKNKHGNNRRCTAINLQNDHTIEFRIFRGTLHLNSILKNIEFIKCCLDYCVQSSLPDINKGRFVIFARNNRRTFPNLAAFLKAKSL